MDFTVDNDLMMEAVETTLADEGQKDAIPALNEDVLCEIFQFLPVPDKKTCSLVDTTWNRVTKMPKIAENMVWTFDVDYIFENFDKFFSTWHRSRHPNLYHIELISNCNRKDLKKSEVQMLYSTLKGLAEQTKILTFSGSRSYVDNLFCFPQLRVLNIPHLAVLKVMKDIPETLKSIHVKVIGHRIDPRDLEVLRNLANLSKITSDKLENICFSCQHAVPESVQLFEIPLELHDMIDRWIVHMDKTNVWKLEKPMTLKQFKLKEFEEEDELFTFSATEYVVHKCMSYSLQNCPKFNSFHLSFNTGSYIETIFKTKKIFKVMSFPLHQWFCLSNFVELNMDYRFNLFKHLEVLKIAFYDDEKENFKKWPDMPSLKVLHLNLNCVEFIDKIAEKCPEVREFDLHSNNAVLKLAQLHKFTKKWPYLKKLKINCKGYRFSPEDFLRLHPNFRALRELQIKNNKFVKLVDGALEEAYPDEGLEKKLMVAIPTLRQKHIFSNSVFF